MADELPALKPEDRVSRHMDYAQMVSGYDEIVAEMGEEEVREGLDYLFYFWTTSDQLLDRPEFADWHWPLDPHDYLVYELLNYMADLGDEEMSRLQREGLDRQLVYMVSDGLRRYYTPVMRRALARRARKLAQRADTSVLEAQAQALVIAAEELELAAIVVGLLAESFRRALLEAALELPATLRREWEERNPALDRWLDEIRAAETVEAAGEAVRRLVQAGPQAIAPAAHLVLDEGHGCDSAPMRAGLEVLAALPSHQSLWALRETLLQCPDLSQWAGEQLATRMPELACDYVRYLLQAPRPAPARLAAYGLRLLAEAKCPEAADLAAGALHYQGESETETEAVQTAAGLALVTLEDPAAEPALRAYLADEAANPAARATLERLVRELEEADSGR